LTADRIFDARDHGARGDGRHIDSDAINRAILAAEAKGGGTILLPPGRYLCFSIRLRSNVTLLIADGAILEAADPRLHGGHYDPPEPRPEALYQDFGHSHWHNSLIWGDGLDNVAILGPGRIEGNGLTRDGPGARWRRQAGERPLSMSGMSADEIAQLEPGREAMIGQGNKAIALRDCRNVTIRDLTIRKGGHFAILATGCEQMDFGGLTIDTDRDGIDLDCVRNVRVADCRVNSPNDDAIVLKSSLALGRIAGTEDVRITGCTVSGYDFGTMLDGGFGRSQQLAPDRDRVTGRIKLGTESNGGFRNIRIDNCRLERSRGIALETVDGGTLEDVEVEGIEMREVTTAPIFLRLGNRARGPQGTTVGAMRRIAIRDVEAVGIDPRFCATIAGLAGHAIEDVTLQNVALTYSPGAPKDRPPPAPELEDCYPEPSMFGITPARGLWIRHATDIRLDKVRIGTEGEDPRPLMVTDDVRGLIVDGEEHPTG
jgi:polygalacturonase